MFLVIYLFMNLLETLQHLSLSKEDLQPILNALVAPLPHPAEPAKPQVISVDNIQFLEDQTPAQDGSSCRQWVVESTIGSWEYLGTFSDCEIKDAIEASFGPDIV